VKMNIKGVFQLWTRDGRYHEIPLKECHAWTREGCTYCPDFAAEHADISTGGIGKDNDWTLTIVRTDLGREIISRMIADGSIIARPGDDDPGAIALMHKLSAKSRERWPGFAVDDPRGPANGGKRDVKAQRGEKAQPVQAQEAAPLGAGVVQRPGAEGAKSGNNASFDLSAAQPPRKQP
jgi:Coenzyme F420 hydrogenase/dehydrogenase, beta subunit C terminus